MPVASPHFFRRAANPGINQPLIDAGRSTVGTKTMTENVPATDYLPFALG